MTATTTVTRQLRTLTLAAAQHAIDVAIEHAESLGVPVCVAVADVAGHPLAFARMDGAPLLSGKLAEDKAHTVCSFKGLPTHEWYDVIKDEPPLLHGIVKTDRLIVFGGGMPVRIDGECVGAVGVSGGSADQDRRIATEAVAAVEAL